jgi:Flp pilus assembly secretin CpaC
MYGKDLAMGSLYTRRAYLTPTLASLALAGLVIIGPSSDAAAQDITVMADEAHLLRLDRPGSDVIVGNPSIADVSVQSGKLLVITGKSFGMTNLIVLDGKGQEIVSRKVRVTTDGERMVTLHKGLQRQTLDCQTRCEMTLVPGDVTTHFEALSKSVQAKFGLAQSAVDGGQGPQ